MNLDLAPSPADDRVERDSAWRKRKQLFAPRKKIFPKRVKGCFRRFKSIVMLITLGIYYVSPWIRWHRGPYAPDQAILVDLSSRRFFFFSVEIWPQEFYYVAGLLLMAGFGLFLMTSALGRAWCGYACPQTVWADLFLFVEHAIEGDRNARIKLDTAPWTLGKGVKRVAKHSVWLLISAATGGAWIFYFADARSLASTLFKGEAPAIAYSTVAVITSATYILGGLMREQVCTFMCPWPRIQGAMLDEKSLVVTYNDWRGEPRSRHAKKIQASDRLVGDCVDCNACVAVCPTGIDIRDGQQMECITCALCIDACNGVMDRLGKPRGLVSHETLRDYTSNKSLATDGGKKVIQPNLIRNADGRFVQGVRHFNCWAIFRPRVLFYAAIWSTIGMAMLVQLALRERLALNVVHDRNPQYVLESDGSVRNGYTLRVLNMLPIPRKIDIRLEGLDGAMMKIPQLSAAEGRHFSVQAEPDAATALKVFVTRQTEDRTVREFQFVIADAKHSGQATYHAAFNTPGAPK
ncbi:cytochrome c oxidase accessory protein CcoG [Rhizobium sophoriradicis]|uniref:Cytochrome c oxidase accessory protein CcoG n=1 Tax=Rhizobium sophoriradicis TaxID=1535245 RepID=A0A2A5KM70_9HYPH|nr:cytochrome c oxidase accessory protein CcoG [Rhizobium sophoriradicis]PCK78144.1 cytochrome c oxidase accessory protein CcoG [Rhizobium sophoriradicis]